VHVSNLTRNVTAEHLKEIFGAMLMLWMQVVPATADASPGAGFYGTVSSVELPLDPRVRALGSRWSS